MVSLPVTNFGLYSCPHCPPAYCTIADCTGVDFDTCHTVPFLTDLSPFSGILYRCLKFTCPRSPVSDCTMFYSCWRSHVSYYTTFYFSGVGVDMCRTVQIFAFSRVHFDTCCVVHICVFTRVPVDGSHTVQTFIVLEFMSAHLNVDTSRAVQILILHVSTLTCLALY